MRSWIKASIKSAQVLVCIAAASAAGPVDFAVADYNAALAARNLKWKLKYEVSLDPPETYHIEPFAYGGASITGGDLRGLMYGILEAADQIRSTGRIRQGRGAPDAAIRAVHRFSRVNFDAVDDWRAYFETLARDRFNRFTLIYTEPPADLEKLCAISQTAADYAIDFTLALWYEPDESLAKIVAACPMIRAVQIRTQIQKTPHDLDAYRTYVFKPLHDAGRRIALDPDPELLATAQQEGVAIRSDLSGPAPNFDIEAPADFQTHSEFYWLWGRLGYSGSHDPKLKPAHGEDPEEFAAAAQLVSLLAMAKAPASDGLPALAVLAESLATAAVQLDQSSIPDFQLLAMLARDQATRIRSAN